MQSLYAAAQHFWGFRDVGDISGYSCQTLWRFVVRNILDGYPSISNLLRGTARSQELHPSFMKAFGELEQACLVVHRQESFIKQSSGLFEFVFM